MAAAIQAAASIPTSHTSCVEAITSLILAAPGGGVEGNSSDQGFGGSLLPPAQSAGEVTLLTDPSASSACCNPTSRWCGPQSHFMWAGTSGSGSANLSQLLPMHLGQAPSPGMSPGGAYAQ